VVILKNYQKLKKSNFEMLQSSSILKRKSLRLNQENAKVAEYVSGLERQNKLIRQGYDSEFIGRYSGSRTAGCKSATVFSRTLNLEEDLLKQYQSGDITKVFMI
jgi:hypothetical protein